MLKTLREDGFKVTAFERRKQVGGLWAYTKDPSMTSALPCEWAVMNEMYNSSREAVQPQELSLASILAACRIFRCQTVSVLYD